MEKFFRLNTAPYHRINAIRVTNSYQKKTNEYVAYVEFVETDMNGIQGLYGKTFCKEYYDIGGDGMYHLVDASRRSKKKEEETAKIVNERAREFAEMYIAQVSEKIGKQLKIVA